MAITPRYKVISVAYLCHYACRAPNPDQRETNRTGLKNKRTNTK